MKCMIKMGILGAVLFGITACANNDSGAGSSNPSSTESADFARSVEPSTDLASKFGRTLVVYFSQPETEDPDNMTTEEDNSATVVDGKVLGNVQFVGQTIQENIGADIFRIEPAEPYPTDHEKLVDLASKEQEDNVRPALAATIDTIDEYDTIFVGYPNWWGDMPMVLYTFLDEHDLSGKTVIPFNVHGGSGFSDTIASIAKEEPEATVVEEGYSVNRNDVDDSEPEIVKWLNRLP
ncbi:flavodoxin [Enterococcus florum]|uniref:Flavodoxin n=1 Tax=Enterococcus florum TaxID=2480627 RepID=A0A4P5P5U8_9ENTE|nr:flavodoxin [Enterococcus florum]GCF93070.1 flavodoxin [Enterococcus florum]